MQDLVAGLPEGPTLTPAVTVLRGLQPLRLRALRPRPQAARAAPRRPSTPRRCTGAQVRGPFVARSETLSVAAAFRSQTTQEDAGRPQVALRLRRRVPPRRFPARDRAGPAGRPAGGLLALRRAHRPVRAAPARGRQGASACTRRRSRAWAGTSAAIDTRMPPLPGPAPRRPLRRPRAQAGRARVRHAGAVPEPRVRAGRRHRRRRCRPSSPPRAWTSSTWRSTTTTASPRASGRRSATGSLPGEPWTFVIDRRGRIAARFEGALSARELDHAIDRVLDRRN